MEKLYIKTSRLQIRNLKTTDLEDFFIYRSNPDVTKYQGFDVMSLEQADKFITAQQFKQFGKPGEWAQFAIEDVSLQKLVGDCAIKLDQYDIRIVEIGFTISHLHQRKGYAKEALLGIMQFLFDKKKIHRIVEIVNAENLPSINLIKNIGFRQEGHFIENFFFKGKWSSEFQFAMLKREWDLLHVN